MNYSPFEQFEVKLLSKISLIGLDLSITNLICFLVLSHLILVFFLTAISREKKYIPSNWQTVVVSLVAIINVFYRNINISFLSDVELVNHKESNNNIVLIVLLLIFIYIVRVVTKNMKRYKKEINSIIKFKHLVYAIGFLEVSAYGIPFFLTNQYFFSFLVYLLYACFIIFCEFYSFFEKSDFIYLNRNNWVAVIVDYLAIVVASINYFVFQNNFGFKNTLIKAFLIGMFLVYFNLLQIWLLVAAAVLLITNKFYAYYINDAIYRERINYRVGILARSEFNETRTEFSNKSKFDIYKRKMWSAIFTKISETASKTGWIYPTTAAAAGTIIEGVGAQENRKKREETAKEERIADEKTLEDAHANGQYTNVSFPPRTDNPPASFNDNVVTGVKKSIEVISSESEKKINQMKKYCEDFMNKEPTDDDGIGGFGDF